MNKKVAFLLVLSSALLALNFSARADSSVTGVKHSNSITTAPVANFTASTTMICVGQSITYTDLSTNAPTTWNWTFTGGTPPTSTMQNQTVVYNTPGTYSVKLVVSNVAGADSLTKTNYITVNPMPVVSITSSADTICQGNSDTLFAHGANGYFWSTGATTSSITVNPSTSLTYWVAGTSLNCTDSSRFTVTVNPSPDIVILGSDSICFGGSTTLTATGAINYFWAPSSGLSCTSCPSPVANPTVTTIYTIIGTDNNGCSNAITYTVYVLPLPTVSAGSDQTVCTGVSAKLTATGTPTGGTYLWEPCNKSGKTIIDTPAANTTYTVYYTNSCGTVSDTVTVFVSPIPNLVLFDNFKTGCAPLCIQFRALNTVPAAKIITWSWSFGDTGTSNLQDPPYCYEIPGTYTCTLFVETSAGCTSTTQMGTPITVYPLPKADFTFSPNPVTILDPLVNFTDKSTGAYPITNWFWTFGDGKDSISDSRYPSHLYSDTGVLYCPELIVEDIHKCLDSIKECFTVKQNYSFYIPNSFSPNGDNVNDYFMPRGADVKAFEMYIFDRWGMQLYHTIDFTSLGWNGKVQNKGPYCQEDAYEYVITATDGGGIQHHFTGVVYLIK